MMAEELGAVPVMKFRSVTIFPPGGQQPIQIDGPLVLATKLEAGVPAVAARDPEGRIVHYVGMPYFAVLEDPSGIVRAMPRVHLG
jgi:hypothetical protein